MWSKALLMVGCIFWESLDPDLTVLFFAHTQFIKTSCVITVAPTQLLLWCNILNCLLDLCHTVNPTLRWWNGPWICFCWLFPLADEDGDWGSFAETAQLHTKHWWNINLALEQLCQALPKLCSQCGFDVEELNSKNIAPALQPWSHTWKSPCVSAVCCKEAHCQQMAAAHGANSQVSLLQVVWWHGRLHVATCHATCSKHFHSMPWWGCIWGTRAHRETIWNILSTENPPSLAHPCQAKLCPPWQLTGCRRWTALPSPQTAVSGDILQPWWPLWVPAICPFSGYFSRAYGTPLLSPLPSSQKECGLGDCQLS